ncbi:MAG: hypothetical protein K2H87_00210 [Duncaniella sp.]|nr:hypothetical protein [Duncaniella sp.]
MRLTLLSLSALLALCAMADTSAQAPEMRLQLPEVVVKPNNKPVLHMLGFVREYSTLSTNTDTIFMFREKWVDFMLPGRKAGNFRGWRLPRLLTSRSYYRFADGSERDSVSDRSPYHFSYGDWLGLVDRHPLYSGTRRESADGWLTLHTDILADTLNIGLMPGFRRFLRGGDVDFDRFDVSYKYIDVGSEHPEASELVSMTADISTVGRGHQMFRFGHTFQDIYVTTRAELYVIDREYLSVREAKKWQKNTMLAHDWTATRPPGLPELSPETLRLMARVDSIDHEALRLNLEPSQRLVRTIPKPPKQTFLQYLKSLVVH